MKTIIIFLCITSAASAADVCTILKSGPSMAGFELAAEIAQTSPKSVAIMCDLEAEFDKLAKLSKEFENFDEGSANDKSTKIQLKR